MVCELCRPVFSRQDCWLVSARRTGGFAQSGANFVAGPGAYQPSMANPTTHVQEMQGLYGPFTIAERVVQKIWLRRDFEQTGLQLLDGRTLQIRTPGHWNLLGGPDFRLARLLVEGRSVLGDVEVHFHSADWHAHRHAEDRAYDNVVLHVIMFPPSNGERRAERRDGSEIPTLVLLPQLDRGLEEYASDDALEKMTARDAVERIAELAAMPKTELLEMLRALAKARWESKVRFAALRIGKLGWPGAAHHAALEILGYRRNRAPMLATATAHALNEWSGARDVAAVFAERTGQWQLQGMRPANHPLGRLRQYQEWVRARPDWPERLRCLALPAREGLAGQASTALFRKQHVMAGLRETWSRDIVDDVLGGSRLDTLVCDGFLPLLSSETGRDLFPLWFHWFLGDVPVEVREALGALGVAGTKPAPFCHGWAQGFLGWISEREARASR